MKEEQLIFIVSQPRSGSTMLQALLSNNNKVSTVSEPWLLLPFLSYQRNDLHNSQYDSNLASAGIIDFKRKLPNNDFDADLKRFLLNQYAKLLREEEFFVLDKTPRYYEILDEIVQYFPHAKIILLKRNPFAVLSSIISTWNVNINKLQKFRRDLLEAPYIIDKFSKTQKDNSNVCVVHYETLVANPYEEIQKLLDWIGLGDVELSVDYSDNEKFIGKMGDPIGVVNTKLPTMDSINKWEKILEDKFWRNFFSGYSEFLGEDFLIEYGGYKPVISEKSKEFTDYFNKVKNLDFFSSIATKDLIKCLIGRASKKLFK